MSEASQSILLPELGALVPAKAPFVVFELSGPPRGKGALRYRVQSTKYGSAYCQGYTDTETMNYMEDLAFAAVEAMAGRQPTDKPVALLIHAFFPVPASWPRRDQENALAGRLRPTGKPDWDNIGKMADALTGTVWRDDAPIVDGRVIKLYSKDPGLRIEVREFLAPERDGAVELR